MNTELSLSNIRVMFPSCVTIAGDIILLFAIKFEFFIDSSAMSIQSLLLACLCYILKPVLALLCWELDFEFEF